MSRPPIDRNYSFETNDETSLSAQRQPNFQPYRDDSPTRNADSLAPGYQYEAYTPSNAPTPPLHREDPFSDSHAALDDRARNVGYSNSMRTASTTTPGMDNLGHASPGGGVAGLAYGVAGANERESGVQAMREVDNRAYDPPVPVKSPYDSQSRALETGYPPAAAVAGAGAGAGWTSNHHDQHGMPLDHYPAQPVNSDGPYNKRYSSPWDSRGDQNAFDPNDIEDDGDDGLMNQPSQRRSMLSLGRMSSNNLATGVGTAASNYGPLGRGNSANNGSLEKGLKAEEARQRKKKRVCLIILGIIAVIAVFAGAITGGILGTRKSSSDSSDGSGLSASDDDGAGDLNKGSSEIKKLMNNKDLHRVFPGMDYTPYNAQYPACLSNPTSQNNITRDMAVLSQLTNVIRLYGTDCNQTDMVLHSMKQLGLDDMKVWMAVWLEKNATTNARGMRAMYDIIDRNGPDKFAGVIIGNEVLYREDMTPTELANVVAGVKSNFTEKNIKLPIGVADLGDNWRKDGQDFIKSVDVVMSNIHPFFAGVTAEEGAGWTYQFWTDNDISLTAGTSKKNIISEVGWPSEGGNDCGEGTCKSKTDGSVAGIDEMNTFMEDFVCQSLKNGTDYFW